LLQVLPDVLSEGTHMLIPLVERPIIFDVRTRPRAIKSTTGTRGEEARARRRCRASRRCAASPRRPLSFSLFLSFSFFFSCAQTCKWWTLACAC
jgi:hypothetical protein